MVILAVIFGCLLSFLCGAGVVYAREFLHSESDRHYAEISDDEGLKTQWEELLSYDGDSVGKE